MFEKAKNFIVNNSSFLDVSSIGRFYAEKVIVVNSPQVQQQSDWPEDISTNYRILKLGDVHVVDGDIDAGKRYNDVVVEVSGETKKRAARIYLGCKGQKRLKWELELLHKLWGNPRIVQVYGVVKSHDKVGLVYHHDGMLHKVEDVMEHMSPLQRAVINITFITEYYETFDYIKKNIGLGNPGPRGPRDAGNYPKTTLYPLENGAMSFHVDALGRLRASLLERPQIKAEEKISFHMNSFRRKSRIPNSDLEMLHSIKDSGHCIIDGPRAMQMISIVHLSFLSVMQVCNRIISSGDDADWVLGAPVIITSVSPYSHSWHLLSAPRIEVKNLHVRVSWQPYDETSKKVLLNASEWAVDGHTYTRFEVHAPRKAIYMNELSIRGTGHIGDETFYSSWLYLAPQILGRDTKLFRHRSVGIVSGVTADIKISVYFTSLLRHLNEKKIYLFISDLYNEPITGEIYYPHIYWSFDESGAEKLRFPSSIGILDDRFTVVPKVAYWDQVVYEALRDLYKMCRLTTSDISYRTNYVHTSRASSYLDDTVLLDLIMSDSDRSVQSVRKIRYAEPIYKPNTARFWVISSLSKIGITFLEDCKQLKNTAYETLKLQRKRRKDYERELWEELEESNSKGEDWIRITSSDIESDSSGSYAEEI